MKIQTSVTGIGSTLQERATARIREALLKRQGELRQSSVHSPTVDGTTAIKPPYRGGE